MRNLALAVLLAAPLSALAEPGAAGSFDAHAQAAIAGWTHPDAAKPTGATWNDKSQGASTGLEPWGIEALAMVTPAVPEPGTYALMLAGLGAVGVVTARRRRR
jgi:hypothetical protein